MKSRSPIIMDVRESISQPKRKSLFTIDKNEKKCKTAQRILLSDTPIPPNN